MTMWCLNVININRESGDKVLSSPEKKNSGIVIYKIKFNVQSFTSSMLKNRFWG